MTCVGYLFRLAGGAEGSGIVDLLVCPFLVKCCAGCWLVLYHHCTCVFQGTTVPDQMCGIVTCNIMSIAEPSGFSPEPDSRAQQGIAVTS